MAPMRKISTAIIFRHRLYPACMNDNSKNIKQNNSNTKLIDQEYFPDLFYAEYSFFEGEESNLLKHNVIVNYLPYFSCIIQPKEHSADTGLSRKILLNETLQEINHRMYRIYNKTSKTSLF